MLRRLLDWLVLGHDMRVAAVTTKKALSSTVYANMTREHQRAAFGFVQILLVCHRCGTTRHEEMLGENLDLSAYLAERMAKV